MNQRSYTSWIWRNLPFKQKGSNQYNKRLKLPFAMPPMNCSMKRKVLLERMYIICVLQYCVILFLWKERFCSGKKWGIFYEKKGFVGKKFFQRMRCVRDAQRVILSLSSCRHQGSLLPPCIKDSSFVPAKIIMFFSC